MASLSTSLLADMSEQQMMDVAMELSRKTADDESKRREDSRAWFEARFDNGAAIGQNTRSSRKRPEQKLDDEVAVDEAATAARKQQKRSVGVAEPEAECKAPTPGSPRARAAQAAEARSAKQTLERLASQRRMRRV